MAKPTEAEMREVVDSNVNPIIENFKRRIAAGQPFDDELRLLAFRCFTSGCRHITTAIQEGVRKGH